jgi:hypothetical protein
VSGTPWWFSCIVFALVAFVFAVAYMRYRRSTTMDVSVVADMKETPSTQIAAVRDGERVRVAGIAEAPKTITAPVSRRECVCWHLVVKEPPTRRNGPWSTILEEHAHADFAIRDATGVAWIRVTNASIALGGGAHGVSGMLADAPDSLVAFLEDRGHASLFTYGDTPRLAYNEGIVEVGEPMTVLGLARWEDDPDPSAERAGGFRERPKRLVIEASSLTDVAA